MVQLSLADESQEYREFVEKFKPKKTTDDCYTPQNVYDAVADWVTERYGVRREDMVRPFWPGGDYERFEYPEGCCVVDNPPFSISSKIYRYYQAHGIKFFLFCPSLTCIQRDDVDATYVIADANVTYENGAVVRTAFATNLDDRLRLFTAPDLMESVRKADKENTSKGKVELPKYVYPDSILTAARAQWLCTHHTVLEIPKSECVYVSSIDDQKGKTGKSIFGGGLLLSERAAAERAAAERAAAERAAAERAAAERAAAERFELSERELKIQKMLGAR